MNPTILDVVKKEVMKLLAAGIIYPISDSQWVSLVQVVPKKYGMIMVKNQNDELIFNQNSKELAKISNAINVSVGVIDISDVVEVVVVQPPLSSMVQPLHAPVITTNKLQVEQKEKLLQDLKKLGDFYEHLVKHSTLRFLLKKPPEDVTLEMLRWIRRRLPQATTNRSGAKILPLAKWTYLALNPLLTLLNLSNHFFDIIAHYKPKVENHDHSNLRG
ncbi:hypothetical protein CR513_37606, partial [Mucuna pruriens]